MPDTPHSRYVDQYPVRANTQPPNDAQRKLEENKQQVLSLLRDCQFSEVLVRLVPLTRLQGPGTEPYVAWAQQELTRLRALPPDVVQKGPTLVPEAIKLLAQQNFAQVIRLLECIPPEFRPPETVSLLQQARALQTEAEQLNERMKRAIHQRQYDGLRESVLQRLLEIEPGNLTARDLYEHLATYGPGEPLRFDRDGTVLPAHGKGWWLDRLAQLLYQRLTRRRVPRGKTGVRRTGEPTAAGEGHSEVPWGPIAVGLGLVGLLLLATVLILRTPKGTVVVEIDEPNAVVSVDDGKLTFTTTEAKQPLELRLSKGEHTVTVTREGSKPYTRRLLVKKGQTETIRIDLATASIQEPGGGSSAPSTLAAASSAGPPASAADKGPKPAPPLAVAPFDAAGAKQHQRAWADYLGVPVEMTNSIGIKFMLIPPGEFDMGSTQKEIDRLRQEGTDGPNDTFGPFLAAEVPRHRVRITRPFYLGTYEVTQGQYQRVTGTNPSHFSAGGKGQDKVVGKDTSSHPVETVSWDDAQQFCGKLSAVPGEKAASRVYRLPTEAEWEFTCRAGTTTRYHFGDDVAKLADFAWSGGGPNGVSSPVGLKSPNPWGLYDMHGNVWEWCADWYLMEDYYATSPADDPSGPASGKARIVRGGSWYNIPGNLRSSVRRPIPPDMRQFRVGLRVACRITNSPAGGAAL